MTKTEEAAWVCAITAPLIIFSILVMLLVGCADPQTKMLDVMMGSIANVAERLDPNSIGQVQASGQVINPGYRGEVALVVRAEGTLTGVAGQVQAASQGKLGAATDVQQATIDRIMRDASITSEQRRQMIRDFFSAINQDIRDAASAIRQDLKPSSSPQAADTVQRAGGSDEFVGPPAPAVSKGTTPDYGAISSQIMQRAKDRSVDAETRRAIVAPLVDMLPEPSRKTMWEQAERAIGENQ